MTSTLCDMLLSRLTFAVLIAASAAEEEQSACMSAPCQNGGMCRSEAGTYTCTCPVGVIGVNCETRVMDGMPCTCKNGVAAAQQCNARMPSRCMSCDAGYYLFGGKCQPAHSVVPPPPAPRAIPITCTRWYDGCNDCTVRHGRKVGCTRRMCKRMGGASTPDTYPQPDPSMDL
jgi:hypothetical protein